MSFSPWSLRRQFAVLFTLFIAAPHLILASIVPSYISNVAPSVPSVAWIAVRPTVNGEFMDQTNPGPSPRCEHTFSVITTEMARLLRPDIDIGGGHGIQELDDGEPTFAFMFGGYDGAGRVGDSWLLRVTSTNHDASADWISLTPSVNATALSPRSEFSLEFLPEAKRLVAFGGRGADGNYLSDAWEYNFGLGDNSINPGWTPLDLISDGINLDPVARASNGGWIRIHQSTRNLEDLLFFGGRTTSTTTLTGETDLNDLWLLQRNADGTNDWIKPENITCLSTELQCPDALPFGAIFPDLAAFTDPIQARYVQGGGVRPDDVISDLDFLIALNQNFSDALQTPDYLNYNETHNTTDGSCQNVCLADDTSTIQNRPTAREGHRMSLWNWTDPNTGIHYNKLIVWGGYVCGNGAVNLNCYDPDLYFLDLETWQWSVVRQPKQPPATPLDAWPLKRAYHTQHVYTTATTAQLWIFGGMFIDLSNTLTFKNDFAVFDLVTMRWYLSTFDLTQSARIDTFGVYWYNPHQASTRVGSFLTSNQLWLHGGCSSDVVGDLIPIQEIQYPDNSWGQQLWVLKLGQFMTPAMARVDNDVSEWLFGQGVTKAEPGRKNYFFIEIAENLGTVKTWTNDSAYGVINAQLEDGSIENLPATNSTPYPYWGYNLPWATGMSKRFTVQLVSKLVASTYSTVTTTDSLVVVQATVAETLQDGIYVVNYIVSTGSTYEVYVWFDGVDVPGSPFQLHLDTGLVSPKLTRPADLSVPIPTPRYDQDGNVQNQHYGNFVDIPEPPYGPGLGLVKGLRKSSASFLLQIVDIYANLWNDNTNAVHYLNDSIYSAVPFDAINLTISLLDPDTKVFQREMDITKEFHYINNEDGTYSVTYLVPDEPLYRLQLSINKEIIDGGNTYLVTGVAPLDLSEEDQGAAEEAGMLSISVILSVTSIVFLVFFFIRSHSPIMQSRSLLFDALFVLGTIFGTFTTLDQTSYSGGIKKSIHGDHNGTHNQCVMYNVLLGMCIILCYGSLYGMVRRAHLIFKRVRQSAIHRDNEGARYFITLNQDNPNTPRNAPIPKIPYVQPDYRILFPVGICIVIELVFQTIWYGVAPLEPTLTAASDNFRSYQICDGPHKSIWVYVSIGIKGLMCAFFMYFISNGRKINDPINETKIVAWVGWNMSFTTVVATLLVFFLDRQDSIKTSFIVSTFALFWSSFLFLCLIFGPRLRTLIRKNPDQYWYDQWIISVQEDELIQRAREEKERKSGMNQSQGDSMMSGSGASGMGGSTMGSSTLSTNSVSTSASSNPNAPRPVPLARGASSGSLKQLGNDKKELSSSTSGSVKPGPKAAVSRALPKTANPGARAAAASTAITPTTASPGPASSPRAVSASTIAAPTTPTTN